MDKHIWHQLRFTPLPSDSIVGASEDKHTRHRMRRVVVHTWTTSGHRYTRRLHLHLLPWHVAQARPDSMDLGLNPNPQAIGAPAALMCSAGTTSSDGPWMLSLPLPLLLALLLLLACGLLNATC